MTHRTPRTLSGISLAAPRGTHVVHAMSGIVCALNRTKDDLLHEQPNREQGKHLLLRPDDRGRVDEASLGDHHALLGMIVLALNDGAVGKLAEALGGREDADSLSVRHENQVPGVMLLYETPTRILIGAIQCDRGLDDNAELAELLLDRIVRQEVCFFDCSATVFGTLGETMDGNKRYIEHLKNKTS